jgi:hypothetical protein
MGTFVIAWQDCLCPEGPRFRVTKPQYALYANRVAERLNNDPADSRALAVLNAFLITPFAIALNQGGALHE